MSYCVEIKFYGAFALNRRVDLHAIDAARARWRGDAGSSPLDGASTADDSLVDYTGVILEEKDVFIKTLIQTPKGKQ